VDIAQAYMQSGGSRIRTRISSTAFAFNGGIDVMDAPSQTAPGHLLGCLNYEPGVRGGYRRFDGIERMDGQLSPSDTAFIAIQVAPGFVPPVGTAFTEAVSLATGTVCYVDTINSYIVLTGLQGTFLCNGSSLTSVYGNTPSIGPGYINGAVSDDLAASYYLAKYTYLQSAILPVGGGASIGPVLGAFPYNGAVYAFRNDVGGNSASMWMSTSSGWQQIPLGTKVRFNAGVYASAMAPPPEGTSLTGAVSGSVFQIKRLVTKTGTWGTDAAGFFIAFSISGTPTPGEALQLDGVTYMTYVSSAPQSLEPNGNYHFRTHNFNANQNPATGFRLYGVNGVDNAFEYSSVDGVFVQIETGMSIDTPTHLEVHNDHLFLAFPGGSLQNSSYQQPLNWQPIFGADARSVGEDVTFLREDVNSTLVIGTRKRIWNLTGLTVELFQIKVYGSNTGAIAYTDENPGQVMFMEDRGFTNATATAAYGDFEAESLSDKILDIVTNLIATDQAVGAVVTRKKNLYRVMFASGIVLCLGINAQGKASGWTQGLYPFPAYGFFGGFGTSTDGTRQIERAFLCGMNGYLYEIDKGRSFDGQNVQSFLRFSYFDAKSHDDFKRWRRLQVDLAPEGVATLAISVDFDFGNRNGQLNQQLDFIGNGGYWDIALWDRFTWSSPVYSQAVMKLEGEGYNIGMFFAGNANNEEPMTLYSASFQFTPRVINRNTKG
jgi:hypothetical protein